tara:strand:+ start:1251 stop:1475 length:225 start_codon:yes stop_codon:yes gene_type:complete
MEYLKVEGIDSLVRDPKSNALINNNTSEYNEYILKKQIRKNESEKIKHIQCELNDLKCDINEIKMMLRNIIDGS